MTLAAEPVDLLLDNDGDIVFVGGDLAFSTGLPAVAQGIRIAVQLFKGEWFEDLDEGVPYLEREGVVASDALLGQRYDQAKALRAFRQAIMRAPGVNAINSLEVARSGRTMTVTWEVTTTLGDTLADSLEREV